MPPITDLTPAQVQANGLPTNAFFVAEDPAGNIGACISLSTLLGETVASLNVECIVKMMTRLREACANAQVSVNENQIDGEKLDAFPLALSSGSVISGYVEQTGSIKSRILVASATEIIGPVA